VSGESQPVSSCLVWPGTRMQRQASARVPASIQQPVGHWSTPRLRRLLVRLGHHDQRQVSLHESCSSISLERCSGIRTCCHTATAATSPSHTSSHPREALASLAERNAVASTDLYQATRFTSRRRVECPRCREPHVPDTYDTVHNTKKQNAFLRSAGRDSILT
jgi:hypothetical protein